MFKRAHKNSFVQAPKLFLIYFHKLSDIAYKNKLCRVLPPFILIIKISIRNTPYIEETGADVPVVALSQKQFCSQPYCTEVHTQDGVFLTGVAFRNQNA